MPNTNQTRERKQWARPLWLGLCILIAWAQPAWGTGLVSEYMQYHPQMPYDPDLLRLTSLSVAVEMNDSSATIVENRSYRWDEFNYYTSEGTVRFHRTLPNCALSSDVEVRINGTLLGGDVLPSDLADQRRRSLVIRSREPGPNRGTGLPLFVSDPLTVEAFHGQVVDVEFRVTHDLTSRGSMQGLSIPIDWHKTPVDQLNVTVTASTDEPIRNLYSPYHALQTDRLSDRHVEGLFAGYDRCTTFDITLLMSTGDDAFHVDLLAHRTQENGTGHFMALIAPPIQPEGSSVAARDVVLVIDRSGSMSGEKISQAKSALAGVLGGLRDKDSFAIVAFDSTVETFAQQATPVSEESVTDGQAFVESIQADGSTNLYDALLAAFQALPHTKGNARYIVVLTDGQPTAGNTNTNDILAMAQQQNEVGARLFTFGIGYDVNTVLLDKLAKESAGDALYIHPGQSVDGTLDAFFAQIVDPTMTGPQLDMGGLNAQAMQPAVLTDLYADQTQIVVGQYEQPGTAVIHLRGQQGGVVVSHDYEAHLPAFANSEPYVPRVWATRRVGSLLEEVKLTDAPDSVVDEAVDLARRYGVVTEFTFFEVDENGDTHMVYSPVPKAASGAVAVQTSSSLDTYQKGGTVGASVDQYVRYAGDRTLPIQQGWFTDTSIANDDPWVIVPFASKLYFEILHTEGAWGIDQYFSVSDNVRFEFLGRNFQITHPIDESSPVSGASPSEAAPSPDYIPSFGPTWVVALDEKAASYRDPTPDDPSVGTTPQKPSQVIVIHGPSNRPHCTMSQKSSGSPLVLLGLFAFCVLFAFRRQSSLST